VEGYELDVFEQEADQPSELLGVFWGGIELVLELNKSASILELSASSCSISLLSCFIRFSCSIFLFSCSISRISYSTTGCQLSLDNQRRQRGSEERNSDLLIELEGWAP
jgi:hypothetical protein